MLKTTMEKFRNIAQTDYVKERCFVTEEDYQGGGGDIYYSICLESRENTDWFIWIEDEFSVGENPNGEELFKVQLEYSPEREVNFDCPDDLMEVLMYFIKEATK